MELLRKGNYALIEEDGDKYIIQKTENSKIKSENYIHIMNEENKASYLQHALDCFRKKTEDKYYVGKEEKYLELYKDEITEDAWRQILDQFNINSEQVKKAICVWAKLDEETLVRPVGVQSEKIYTMQSYCTEFLGFTPTTKGTEDELRDILDERDYELWDYPLGEIDHIVKNELRVVLVDTTYVNDNGEPIPEYRWFEVPEK
ncbi:hypothetical protein [uncultured Eubacterium sp.]|uniref:hypothetical protein n=1 Tax=uncultured Eubacterium sp. TaxID=165185 RepID=UPI0025952800|nr:hypothetical protein [uncultured Eubacterium sp.]